MGQRSDRQPAATGTLTRSRSRSSFSTERKGVDYENENEERERGSAGHGFTLVEMLAVVSMIGVFTLVSTSLFRSSLRWATSAGRQASVGQAMRGMTDRLRADVWNSYEINVGDERTVLLRQVGERTIVWVVGDDPRTGVRRVERTVWRRRPPAELGTEVAERADWPLGEIGVGFEPTPAGLIVWRTAPEGAAAEGPAGRRTQRLMSQLVIEREAGR